MMRCMALDDEPLALELLEDNIRKTPFLSLVASCRNALQAIERLQKEEIDLVFSDVQMPGLSGLQLIEALSVRPMFILITAHEKFALESYDLDVVDYLLKPVPYERFLKACNKALDRYNTRRENISAAKPGAAKEYIFVPVDYKMVKVVLAEVKMVEGVKDYIRIHFTDGKRPLLVRMSMKGIEEALDGGFLRIHKSYIVSLRQITAVRRNSVYIVDLELPVGDQYRQPLADIVAGANGTL